MGAQPILAMKPRQLVILLTTLRVTLVIAYQVGRTKPPTVPYQLARTLWRQPSTLVSDTESAPESIQQIQQVHGFAPTHAITPPRHVKTTASATVSPISTTTNANARPGSPEETAKLVYPNATTTETAIRVKTVDFALIPAIFPTTFASVKTNTTVKIVRNF